MATSLFFLRHELQNLTFSQVVHTLRALPWSALGLAVAFTLGNYAVMTGYDQLGFVYLQRRFPRWQISMASFVGYAISNAVGFAVLSGVSARYRFYSRWGVTAAELSRLVMFYSGTFYLGLLLMGGWGLIFYPPSGLTSLRFHEWSFVAGIVLMSLCACYVIASFAWRKPINVFGFTFTIPDPPLVLAQLGLSVVDWTLAVATLWILLPDPRPPFVETVSAFLAAQFLGIMSNVPGGLGVFEFLMIALLGPRVPPEIMLPALIAFRVIYYLMPLVLALIILLVDESYQRRHVVRRWGNAFGTLTVSLAPKVLAVFTFIAGAILLFSGATPAAHARLRLLSRVLPLPVIELSHFVGSLVGLGLLMVSQALMRRVDAAWTLTIGGLGVGIVASLLKGLDYEEAIVLSFLLIVLVAARSEFDRRATLFERSFTPRWLAAVALVVLASVVLGEFAFRQVRYSDELWWRFAFNADAPRFLRATVGVAVILLAAGIRLLLRPATPAIALPSPADLDLAQKVIQSQSTSSAYLACLGDKALLWSDDRSAFLMYAVQSRTWVALHDPVGQPRACQALIRRFLEKVDDAGGVPVFYEVRKDYLHRYADFGLAFAKVGEEALVPLQAFSMDGGGRKKMRLQIHKLAREGASFRIVPPAGVPALTPELRSVSDEWLNLKATSEKGFSLGFFDESYLQRFPIALLEVNGRIEGFASVWPGPQNVELSVDLMRHRARAPKNSMEGLFVFLMEWGKSQGYEWFNLGMAPLSGMEMSAASSLWVRLANYLYRYGQPFYNFQGLRAYKEKFDPVWEPRYLVYPGGLALPRVLADVSALIAGGYRGILLRR